MVAGEIVHDKWTWLLDNVEAVGTVHVIDDVDKPEDPTFVKGGGDTFGIIPDPNYRHLIRYMRGNNPLPWAQKDTPGPPPLRNVSFGSCGSGLFDQPARAMVAPKEAAAAV